MSSTEKRAIRDEHRRRRSERDPAGIAEAGERIASHAQSVCEGIVAAYVGIGDEPPTILLVRSLLNRGARVLLPILRTDMDLEWAEISSIEQLAESSYGLLEPTTPSRGTSGIAAVEIVLAPGLGVDQTGNRLGQGGGCYDRALVRTSAPVYAVVFDDEVVDSLPFEPHDRRVDGALTPTRGLFPLGGPTGV